MSFKTNTLDVTNHPQDKIAYSILFMVSIAHLLNDMMQSVVPAIYPIIKDKFGFTFAQIGIITLVFQLTSSLLQPFVGRYADRHHSPYSLAKGMVVTLFGLLLLAVASNIYLILIAVALIGCGSSVFHPNSSQISQIASGGKKGLAQSIFQVGGNAGSAVGPLIAALIIIPLGQHSIGIFALAALIAIFILIKVGNWYKHVLIKNFQPSTLSAVIRNRLSRRQVNMALLILIVLMVSKHFFTASMTNYFTFFMIDKFGVSVQSSQLYLFVYLIAAAIGTVLGGPLGDRFGRKRIIGYSIFGAAPFTLMLPYTNQFWTIVLIALIGIIISSAFSAILVYATELMPGKVSMIAGIFFGLAFGLAGVASAFFGWLADRTSIEFIFQISTILPLLGAVSLFLPDIEHKRARK